MVSVQAAMYCYVLLVIHWAEIAEFTVEALATVVAFDREG
jgi:hypothetical protein